jgi:hypothetical protein
MIQPQDFLVKLNQQLNLLTEREAKYGGNAPVELLNQIKDHRQAIALTQQAIAGELTEADWLDSLQPLLLGNDHWAGISLATMLLLSRYAPDRGTELSQQVGPQATAIAGEILTQSLAQVKTVDPKTAERYSANPRGYEAPLSDALDELLEANQELTTRLKALLARYETESQTYRETGPRAAISGSGVITQQSTQTAGERGVAGSSAGGSIITGDSNIVGDVSVSDSTGVGIGSGQQISVTQGVSGQELTELLATIYRQIEAKTELSPQDRADLKTDVDEIKAEVSATTDPTELNESFMARRLRNIERMAPDIIDTIATTVVNPVAGLKGVWSKIVAKAREIKAARTAS